MRVTPIKVILGIVATSLLASCTLTHDRPMLFVATISEGENKDMLLDSYLSAIQVDERLGVISYSTGLKTSFNACSDKYWYCLSDGFIEFSIPRVQQPGETQWSRLGVSYSMLDSGALKSREMEIHDAVFILARPTNQDHGNRLFVYSRSKGLMAIVIPTRDASGAVVTPTYLRVY